MSKSEYTFTYTEALAQPWVELTTINDTLRILHCGLQPGKVAVEQLALAITQRHAKIEDQTRQIDAGVLLRKQQDESFVRVREERNTAHCAINQFCRNEEKLMMLLSEAEQLFAMGVASVTGGTKANKARNIEEARELMQQIRKVAEEYERNVNQERI